MEISPFKFMTTLLKNIAGYSTTLILGEGCIKVIKPNEMISSDDYTWEDHIVQPLINSGILTLLTYTKKVAALKDPRIVVQPQELPKGGWGANETYTVTAEGTPELHYHWEISDTVVDPIFTSLCLDGNSVTIQARGFDQLLRVTVSNDLGSETSVDVLCLAGYALP